jgi:ketosteroid isomerase-like protein
MNIRVIPVIAAMLPFAGAPLQAQVNTGWKRVVSAELSGPERALDAFHGALRAGNRNAALALLGEDALIYESGHAERKSEYAAHHLNADIAFARAVPGSTLKRSGRRAGQFAWLATEGRTTGSYKGKALDQRTVETALLRLEAGKWLIVHLHWSSAAAK